ncbi:hypothetical protein WR25_23093 [Diploscapter pachys]|uniref:BZIP domain-containing protein n=1 Tax=Diploscapter pachys TaxID=2018661 RepID=A0A2A2LL35_9BILA|nr:hypothetical protein WR25_23093 [Diploscapter pachys]
MDFSSYGLTPSLLQMPALLHPAFLSQLQLHNSRHYAVKFSRFICTNPHRIQFLPLIEVCLVFHRALLSLIRFWLGELWWPRKDQVKDEAYWERRRKNNDAAKRSRDSRRQKASEFSR